MKINIIMFTIIFAGGQGTRISEETDSKPKPMIKIGNKPMLEHIMNMYARFGFKDFVIAAGYKSESIFDWVKQFKTNYNIDNKYSFFCYKKINKI